MMREGEELSTKSLLSMTVRLSIPTVIARLSFIVMEYFDAAMVGRLGGNATASIGLVASSTWLFGGLCSAVCMGFSVQAAQAIGAKDNKGARLLMKHGFLFGILFALVLSCAGAAVHSALPVWLKGDGAILKDASAYFLIFSLFLPFQMFNETAVGMLQSSGNMKVPGILASLMCVFNIFYNYAFIYKFSLGVAGAALGTALAEITVALPMAYFLFVKSPELHLRKGECFSFNRANIKRAVKISLPVGFEQAVMCSAYIMSTRIIAPLGAVAVAAHSLSVTAESICYMPGYGIGTASTTMIGQSIGAKRYDLTRRLSVIPVLSGMAIMGVTGALMYAFAPLMMSFLTPVEEIKNLGVQVLRIEVFAEPMYAASIVALGVFRGMGDTLAPSLMNLFSMWAVRIPLSALLASRLGLKGAWIAMALELCFRGMIFIIRLYKKTVKENAYESETQNET